MSEQIREQVSAFLDGELPSAETELLLKRLARDPELRESFGRYALIGESLRGGGRSSVTRSFAARVNRAIDGEPVSAQASPLRIHSPRWWRPFAGAAVAAGVAAVAVVALQQRAVVPGPHALALTAQNAAVSNVAASNAGVSKPGRRAAQRRRTDSSSRAARPGRVRAARPEGGPGVYGSGRHRRCAGRHAGRALTNYVFAHSQYSSVLGQSNVLSGLLTMRGMSRRTGARRRRIPRCSRRAAQDDQTAP